MEINEKAIAEMTARKKILSLLGLSQKAGYIASGEFMTEKSIKEGRAKLVILALNASENTKKMFRNMCEYYDVPYCCFAGKETLGHAIGKEYRASLAINDAGMAKSVKKHLDMLQLEE